MYKECGARSTTSSSLVRTACEHILKFKNAVPSVYVAMKIYLTGSARHCSLCASYLGQYTARVPRKQPNSKQHLLRVQLSPSFRYGYVHIWWGIELVCEGGYILLSGLLLKIYYLRDSLYVGFLLFSKSINLVWMVGKRTLMFPPPPPVRILDVKLKIYDTLHLLTFQAINVCTEIDKLDVYSRIQ